MLAERLLAVLKRYHLACYVTPELFEAFGKLARSRQMSVTGLLRRLVVAELDGATLLPPAEAERNLLFIVRAVDALLSTNPDRALRDRVVAAWNEEIQLGGYSHDQ